ncbi:MAG TPA: hypothetical protein VFG80_03530 [Myxococcota bacterium]|nr:hypothetical protein [Myxococcota bacterium]
MTPEELRALADAIDAAPAGTIVPLELGSSLARLCAEQDDLLRRFSEWDVLHLVPGSGDDGPYWQGEIAKMRAKLAELEAR